MSKQTEATVRNRVFGDVSGGAEFAGMRSQVWEEWERTLQADSSGARAKEQIGAGVSGNRKPGMGGGWGEQELKLGAEPGQGAPRRRGQQVTVAVFLERFLRPINRICVSLSLFPRCCKYSRAW